MKRLIRNGGLFVLLPLLILEVALRLLAAGGPVTGVHRLHDVYDHLEHRLATGDTTNYLFVGTSRVGAAIRPDTFETAIRMETGQPGEAMRAARGFSTLAMHLEGIEYLIDQRPQAFRGSTVFVEAPAGLVEPQMWSGRLARPQFPQLLSPHLSLAELSRMWWTSDDPMVIKTRVTLSRVFVTVRYGSSLRKKAKSLVSALTAPLTPTDAPNTSPVDLQDAAGVRTDSAGVALTRRKIIPEMRGWSHIDYDRAPMDWDRSVLATLVGAVREAGGNVVVYTMPLSTPARRVIEDSDLLRQDRNRLSAWLTDHGVPFLEVDFPHTNADFPDLSHLRASRSGPYTQQIATTYVRYDSTNSGS